MTDIRLKRITISSGGNLELYNGSITISDTTYSTDKLTSSFLVNGSISITSTYEGVSSTSGGAMTIGGGVGIFGDTFIGGNTVLDTNNSKLIAKGINVDRLRLEDISLKNFYISVDGLDKQFDISPSSISILTTGSNSLVITGDATILSTTGATSSTSGGSLTIGGGLGVGQNVFVEKDLIIKESIIIDYSTEQIILTNITGSSSIISNIGNVLTLDSDLGIKIQSLNDSVIINGNTFENTQVIFNDNIIVNGNSYFENDVFINSTTNATNVTNGALKVFGGLGVIKDVITNGDLKLNSGTFYLGTNGNSISQTMSFFSDNTFNFNSNTTQSAVIGPFYNIVLDSYQISSTNGSFRIENQLSGEQSLLELHSKDQDLGDNVQMRIFGNASNYLKLGWDTNNSEYIITNSSNSNIKISNNNSILTFRDNSILSENTVGATNASSASLVVSGGLGIVKNIYTDSFLNIKDTKFEQLTNGNTQFTNLSNLFKFNGSLILNNTLISDSFISSSNLYNIGSSLFLSTNGNIGINTSSPSVNLQVNGDILSNNLTTGNLFTNSLIVTGETLLTSLLVNQNVLITGNNTILGTNTVSSGSYLYGNLNLYGDIFANNQNMTIGNLYISQNIFLENTIDSTSSTSGSLVVKGGLGVTKSVNIGQNTYLNGNLNLKTPSNNLIRFYNSNLEAFSINLNTLNSDFSIDRYNSDVFVKKSLEISNSTGNLTINENLLLNETLDSYGIASFYSDVQIKSTTYSSNHTSGALVVDGGVGISGDLNVLGNAFFAGNITISGTTNSIYSTNTLISDNVISINSGPSGTFNAGILVERYQTVNDTGDGDVVNDLNYESFTIPSQSGMGSNQLKLSTLASIFDDYYKGWWVKISSGFNVGQVRKVVSYIGSTRILTLQTDWTTQNPSLGDNVNLYYKPFVGVLWDETVDIFKFINTVQNPSDNNIEDFTLNSLELKDFVSENISTGSIITLNTSGNSIYSLGNAQIDGELIVNSVNITPNAGDVFKTVQFSGLNNAVLDPIVDLGTNNVWGFDMFVSIQLVATTNLYSNYHLRGVQKNGTWDLVQSYVGDSIVTFNINNSGIVSYTSSNYSGFVSLTFKYKILTN